MMWPSFDALIPVLACIALTGAPHLAGAPVKTPSAAPAPKAAPAKAAVPATDGERLLCEVARRQGIRKPERVILFYRTCNPAALAELDDQAGTAPPTARRNAQRLVRHFLDLQRVKRRFPDEYKRLIRIEKMESQSLALGRQIRRLRLERKRARGDERKQIDARITAAEKKLRQLLAELFEARQQNQTIAVTRLEAELRELRNLLEQRKANREDILANRFRQLAGADDQHTGAAVPIDWGW